MSDKSNCTNVFLGRSPSYYEISFQISTVGLSPDSYYEIRLMPVLADEPCGHVSGLSHHVFYQAKTAVAI